MENLNVLAFYPAQNAETEYREIACERLIDSLFKQFGTKSNSLILQQSGVKYWGNASGIVGYTTIRTLTGKQSIVFANPICAPNQYQDLLKEFLIVQPNTLFVSVDEAICAVLNRLGYKSNHFGWDNTLNLTEFNTQGSKKKQLRKARNHCKRAELVVVEQTWDEVDPDAVMRVSDEWRKTKTVSNREINLFTRPPRFSNELGVRKFYCYDQGNLIGFVFFLAIYKDNKVIGYGSNITRSLPEPHYSGVTDYIILEAIEKFRPEGLSILSLGISPLSALEQASNERRFLRRVLSWCFYSLNRFYPFQGLANHKKKYRAQGEKWFICSRQNMGIVKIAYCLGFASRVFSLNLGRK